MARPTLAVYRATIYVPSNTVPPRNGSSSPSTPLQTLNPDRRFSAFGGGPLAALVLGSNALARDLRTSPCGALPQQSRNTVRTARKLSPVVMTTERIRRLGLKDVLLFLGSLFGLLLNLLGLFLDGLGNLLHDDLLHQPADEGAPT